MSYLNEQITLAQLVDWAETSFVDGWFEPDEDIPVLRDIMAYLAAADTSAFPLTWDVCLDFMKRLGSPVRGRSMGCRSRGSHGGTAEFPSLRFTALWSRAPGPMPSRSRRRGSPDPFGP